MEGKNHKNSQNPREINSVRKSLYIWEALLTKQQITKETLREEFVEYRKGLIN